MQLDSLTCEASHWIEIRFAEMFGVQFGPFTSTAAFVTHFQVKKSLIRTGIWSRGRGFIRIVLNVQHSFKHQIDFEYYMSNLLCRYETEISWRNSFLGIELWRPKNGKLFDNSRIISNLRFIIYHCFLVATKSWGF